MPPYMIPARLPPEERPRDFRARLPRRAPPLARRWRRGHYGRRFALLAAAVAVPAFAAPVEWQDFAPSIAGQADTQTTMPTMGFETPGASFPGSAFYYLAEDAHAAHAVITAQAEDTLDPGAHWDNDGAAGLRIGPGPAARPLVAGGSETDRSRALACLAQAIYYEAASESDAGQRAVAQVVLNRVAHPTYPNTICGVVYQGSHRRTGCQFTFTCDGSLARKPSTFGWNRARAVANLALAGSVYAPVGLATHYHTVQVHPYWAPHLKRVAAIGAHIFYRWNGAAGLPAAFRSAYLGGEPAASRQAPPATKEAALDPAALATAYEKDLRRATAPKQPTPDYAVPVRARGGETLYAGERLPTAGTVRPEFARSGQWIADPR